MIKKLFIFTILLINATVLFGEGSNHSFYPKKSNLSKITRAKQISEINRPYIRRDRFKRLENAPLPVAAAIHSGVQQQQEMDPEVYMARKTSADNFKQQNDKHFNNVLERLRLRKSKGEIAVFPKNAKTTIIDEVGVESAQQKNPSFKSILSVLKNTEDSPKSCEIARKKASCTKKSCDGKNKKANCAKKTCDDKNKKTNCAKKSCENKNKKANCAKKSCDGKNKKANCTKKSCDDKNKKADCAKKSCKPECQKACCASNKVKRKSRAKKFTDFFKKLVTPSK